MKGGLTTMGRFVCVCVCVCAIIFMVKYVKYQLNS